MIGQCINHAGCCVARAEHHVLDALPACAHSVLPANCASACRSWAAQAPLWCATTSWWRCLTCSSNTRRWWTHTCRAWLHAFGEPQQQQGVMSAGQLLPRSAAAVVSVTRFLSPAALPHPYRTSPVLLLTCVVTVTSWFGGTGSAHLHMHFTCSVQAPYMITACCPCCSACLSHLYCLLPLCSDRHELVRQLACVPCI